MTQPRPALDNPRYYETAFEDRLKHYRRVAQQLDHMGYAVMVNNLAHHFEGGQTMMPDQMVNHATVLVKALAAIGGNKHPVLVFATAYPTAPQRERFLATGRYNDMDIRFHCRIGKIKRLAGLRSALRLAATKVDYSSRTQPGGLYYRDCSNYDEFHGGDRDTLRTFVNFLNMPHHRSMLTGRPVDAQSQAV